MCRVIKAKLAQSGLQGCSMLLIIEIFLWLLYAFTFQLRWMVILRIAVFQRCSKYRFMPRVADCTSWMHLHSDFHDKRRGNVSHWQISSAFLSTDICMFFPAVKWALIKIFSHDSITFDILHVPAFISSSNEFHARPISTFHKFKLMTFSNFHLQSSE